jgi:multiple antibiotic resistance protein
MIDLFVIPFIKAMLLVPITLLPIINPLSTAPVFVATVGHNDDLARRLARQIAINSWFVLVTCMLIGSYVLALFGISLPVVRIGGGLLLAATGWRMLHTNESDDVHTAAAEEATNFSHYEIVKRSFFPMTFPLTTGPGTIAAAIALGAQIPTTAARAFVAGAVVVVLGAALVSMVLYLIFRNSTAVVKKLGPIGTMVMVRLMAFILLCIGIQIIWNGWAELNGLTP